MKAFVSAIAAACVITAGAWFVLNGIGFSAAKTTTVGESVRLD